MGERKSERLVSTRDLVHTTLHELNVTNVT